MGEQATLRDCYNLIHEGARAFGIAERNGMRVDVARCRRERERLHAKMKGIEAELFATDLGRYWRGKFGHKASIGSPAQLSHILYQHLQLWPDGEPRTSQPKTDKNWLPRLRHPVVKQVTEWRKWQKVADTYLMQFIRETGEDGLIHPSFNLHLVITGRSSSNDPNFQNISKHDPVTSAIVRSVLLSRPGRRIVEADYSQLEVRGSVMYHHDPTLKDYLLHNYDMHTSVAKDICLLSDSQWSTMLADDRENAKDGVRFHCGKNGFVFAAFYGDYFGQMAPKMWHAIVDNNLKGPGGAPLSEHIEAALLSEGWDVKVAEKMDARNDLEGYGWLRKDGMDDVAWEEAAIKSRDAWRKTVAEGLGIDASLGFHKQSRDGRLKLMFYHHVERVEKKFWGERFPVYDQWRKDFYAQYLDDGYVDYKTGFRYGGVATRNKIVNAPIQGTSFHILLWAYVELQKEITRLGMRTLLLGQIHDSIVADVPDEEVAMYCALAKDVMERRTAERWDWINIPLLAELELTPVDMPWSFKKDKDVWDALWRMDRDDRDSATAFLRKKCKWGDATVAQVLDSEGFHWNAA